MKIRKPSDYATLSANPKINVAIPMLSLKIMFWKRTLHKYVKRSFPKCVKHQSKNRCSNANAKFGNNVFEKNYLYICTYILIYMYVKSSLTKPQSLNLALTFQAHSFACFGKELFKYIYPHIYICEKLFSKTTIIELGIGIASSFSGMPLNAFWKRALLIHIAVHIEHLCIYESSLLSRSNVLSCSYTHII